MVSEGASVTAAMVAAQFLEMGGALTVTLYKGIPLISNVKEIGASEIYLTGTSDWIIGAFLLATGSLGLSVLYIVQTWVIREYPEELVVTSISCGLVVILSAIVALIVEGNSNIWTLRPDKELVVVCYSAIFVVSMRSVVYTWTFRKKGPIYVAMFYPLGMVIALGMGVIFLGDSLYLGSMIGAAIIAIGFYAVIWAQAQEEQETSENNISSSSSAPLLSTKNMDI
ncbi:hypothetical protein TSUD_220600 [Trifolium subterraneum]|uniref:WAT1-related protein n=1 Tax=Trifolium subterraneum TaxID=3900 RepID=A0A2Z6MZF2_TRISU|nr:hypothetical protein TSUD_220600 [Trifolium subterraneum]